MIHSKIKIENFAKRCYMGTLRGKGLNNIIYNYINKTRPLQVNSFISNSVVCYNLIFLVVLFPQLIEIIQIQLNSSISSLNIFNEIILYTSLFKKKY